MEKKIVVCIGTDRSHNVRARLSLMLLDGDGQVVNEHYHSVMIESGDSLDEVRKRAENHLAMTRAETGIPLAPWPKIPDEEWAKVEAVCRAFQRR